MWLSKRVPRKKCGRDIDECDEEVDECDPTTGSCRNEIGGYSCECNEGYVKSESKFFLNKNIFPWNTGPIMFNVVIFLKHKLRIFRYIYEIWKENLPFKWKVFLPDVCQMRSRWTRFVHVSEREFFSANCSTVAVECDWNRKISQSERNLVFEKNRWAFLNKIDFFFKIAKGGKLAVECVSIGYYFLKWSIPP